MVQPDNKLNPLSYLVNSLLNEEWFNRNARLLFLLQTATCYNYPHPEKHFCKSLKTVFSFITKHEIAHMLRRKELPSKSQNIQLVFAQQEALKMHLVKLV